MEQQNNEKELDNDNVTRHDGSRGTIPTPCERVRNRLNVLTTLRKAAFTLAEVLITLGVIGIVAAMTIPTLVTQYQKKVVAVKLQKFYSLMYQAIQLENVNNNDIDELFQEGKEGTNNAGGKWVEEHLNKNLQIIKKKKQ